MSERELRPVQLTAVHHESEAGIIVSALSAQGIESNFTGASTSGFRAEVPGMVEIWVHERNLEKAREILANLESSSGDIDWSQVDTGDSSPITDEESEEV